MIEKILGGVLGSVGAGLLLVKIFCPWVLYDILHLKKLFKCLGKINKIMANDLKLIDLFEEQATKQPDKPFLLFEDEVFTYRQADERTNRFAQLALNQGVKPEDTVAIMVSNEPDFVWTVLGFLKIGARTALINTSVRGKCLLHLIMAAKPKILIVGKDLIQPVVSLKDELSDIPIYCYGDNCPSGFLSLDSLLADASDRPVDKTMRSNVKFEDPVAYIYTSGTTGLPKAAIFTQHRLITGSAILPLCGMTGEDVLYVTLPLYHSAGLCLGLSATIHTGATCVLKRKFSARAFWDDCRQHNVTIVQYIGELCRYLVSSPKKGSDQHNSVRMAFGNGLRMDIWKEFQERFNIPSVVEFYASTEGTCSTINLANKVGALGRHSPLLEKVFPMKLVEFSTEDALPTRDERGRCIPVKAGSKGLLLTPVSKKFPYQGYLGPKATSERKLVRDVVKQGDVYFNSGDVLYLDDEYFLYFDDRLGDTFRWKGENVSTTEVANVLTETKFISDSNVYGVQIPGQEGRSGMAAIVANDGRPLTEGQRSAIYRLCDDFLAPFARPRFLRVQKQSELTVTYKQKKTGLVEEGFDINIINDPLYFLDQDNKSYVPLDENLYLRVINGGVRV